MSEPSAWKKVTALLPPIFSDEGRGNLFDRPEAFDGDHDVVLFAVGDAPQRRLIAMKWAALSAAADRSSALAAAEVKTERGKLYLKHGGGAAAKPADSVINARVDASTEYADAAAAAAAAESMAKLCAFMRDTFRSGVEKSEEPQLELKDEEIGTTQAPAPDASQPA
jgi:hypothetical protein